MKTKSWMKIVTIMFLVVSTACYASTVYESKGWTTGRQDVNPDFTALNPPFTYGASITDSCVDSLFLFISMVSVMINDIKIDLEDGPGSVMFDVLPEKSFSTTIFGEGTGLFDLGNLELQINTVPVSPILLLLGSGIFALVCIPRRKK